MLGFVPSGKLCMGIRKRLGRTLHMELYDTRELEKMEERLEGLLIERMMDLLYIQGKFLWSISIGKLYESWREHTNCLTGFPGQKAITFHSLFPDFKLSKILPSGGFHSPSPFPSHPHPYPVTLQFYSRFSFYRRGSDGAVNAPGVCAQLYDFAEDEGVMQKKEAVAEWQSGRFRGRL